MLKLQGGPNEKVVKTFKVSKMLGLLGLPRFLYSIFHTETHFARLPRFLYSIFHTETNFTRLPITRSWIFLFGLSIKEVKLSIVTYPVNFRWNDD